MISIHYLEAIHKKDQAADRRVKGKQDAQNQGTIEPKGPYSVDGVWDRETSAEDVRKRVAERKR